jgi:hypothetical protein
LIGRNTPIRVKVTYGSDVFVRFVGEVTSWPSRWDVSERDIWVPVTASGILRRLGQGSKPVRSTMYRYLSKLSGTVPVASWSLEDGPLSTVGAPMYGTDSMKAFVGTHPSGAVITYPEWGSGVLAPWLSPVVSRSGNAGLSILWAAVSMPTFTNQWAVDFVYASSTGAATSAVDINPSYLGGALGWPQLTLDPENETVAVSFDGSPETTTAIPGLLFDGLAHHVRWHATQDGADIDWTVYVDGIVRQTGTEVTATLAAVTTLGLTAAAQNGADIALGYVSVWTSPAAVADSAEAALGYVGEFALDRFERLCLEAGLPFDSIAAPSALMGPERPGPFLQGIRDAEATDQGFLFETRGQLGLAFRANASRYNQAPVALDYTNLSSPFDPEPDDRSIRNDIEVKRRNGGASGAHTELTTGSLSTQDPPDGVGRYDDSTTVDAYSEDQLEHIASWRLHVGTWDAERYPRVKVDLASPNNASIVAAVAGLDCQDLITIDNLPAWLPPETCELLIEGYTENIGLYTWDFTFNTSPAGPYNVVGVNALLSHELHTAMNTSVTSADIATTTTGQPLLATSGLGSGYSITIGAEELQVTAVAASTITFGATGTASSGSSGSRTPALPTSSASGNLILIFASTRNSGTGTVDTPTNWTRLPIFPVGANCQVFGRIYDGVWTMPTITYTSGSANEDTIAQSMRLAGKWHSVANIVIGAAAKLNASAANIAYPDLPKPQADDSIILYFAWKQDDYTSIVGPGTEIQEASSTAGNDASQSWAYTIQTTAAAIAPGVFTPTGGASAISRGAIAALRCDYQTATVTRSINGVTASHSAADAVTATRPMRYGLI